MKAYSRSYAINLEDIAPTLRAAERDVFRSAQ